MVLTNFECWAHGGGAVIGNGELPVNSRHMDMFNPRVVQQRLNPANTGISPVSHISSNGYYGFSYVNAAHELGDNYQYNGVTHDANNTNINNNNNNNTCVPNANDVNGMLPMMHTGMDVGVETAGAAAAFGSDLVATQRRKKRYFVSDDDYANCALLNGCDSGVGIRDVAVAGLDGCAPKRCRYDDDYAAAQYCNDFFSLPSTQIGTQSCLMDTEDIQQQQQPQVDVNNGAANLTNQTTNTTTKKCQQAINYGINLNVYNNNNNNNLINKYNNKLLYNNQHRLGSEKRGSVDKSCESSSTEDMLHDRVVGIKANNLYLRQQAKFPAFAADCMGGKNAAAEAAAGSSNEDNSVLAALYNKTHGGAFYHFTVSNNENQPFVEDI